MEIFVLHLLNILFVNSKTRLVVNLKEKFQNCDGSGIFQMDTTFEAKKIQIEYRNE
jgi:hypothetical protein